MNNDHKVECLLCKNSAKLMHRNFPGYQEPDTFEIYYCPSCNTSFSLPRVETASIYENIYKNGRNVPGYDRYWDFAETVNKIAKPLEYLAENEEAYWSIKEALTIYVKDKKTTKILEIGSGLGYLTYSLIKENYDVLGLDISNTAVNQAIKIFGEHYICTDIFEYALHYAETFDIVILTEVIEHIDKPLDFIEVIKKLLKPNGKAIITTPNKSFFTKDILWISDLPPVHCWWLSEDSMKYIGNKLGLKIEFLNFIKYYQKHYKAVNLKVLRNNQIQRPMLNENGLLISRKIENRNSFFHTYFFQIPCLKYIYRLLRDYFNSNIIVCKEKGTVLCTILEKI